MSETETGIATERRNAAALQGWFNYRFLRFVLAFAMGGWGTWLIPVIPDKVRTAVPVKQAAIRMPEKRLAATRQNGIGIDGEQAFDALGDYFNGVNWHTAMVRSP